MMSTWLLVMMTMLRMMMFIVMQLLMMMTMPLKMMKMMMLMLLTLDETATLQETKNVGTDKAQLSFTLPPSSSFHSIPWK